MLQEVLTVYGADPEPMPAHVFQPFEDVPGRVSPEVDALPSFAEVGTAQLYFRTKTPRSRLRPTANRVKATSI